MFCRRCGLKIEGSASRCRRCGEPVSTAEYCGGFWGILNQQQRQDDRRPGRPLSESNQKTANREEPTRSTEDLSRVSLMEIERRRVYEAEREKHYDNQLRGLKEENSALRHSRRKTVLLLAVLGLVAMISCVFAVIVTLDNRNLRDAKEKTEEELVKLKGTITNKDDEIGTQNKDKKNSGDKTNDEPREDKEKEKENGAREGVPGEGNSGEGLTNAADPGGVSASGGEPGGGQSGTGAEPDTGDSEADNHQENGEKDGGAEETGEGEEK